jgi:hypothetical protein
MKLIVCQNFAVVRQLAGELGLPQAEKQKQIYASKIEVHCYEPSGVAFVDLPAACNVATRLDGLMDSFEKVIHIDQKKRARDLFPADVVHVSSVEQLSDELEWILTPSIKNKLANRLFGVAMPIEEDDMDGILLSDLLNCPWMMRLKPVEEGDNCVVCKDAKATIMFLPCQHQCACDNCARILMDPGGPRKCPICRAGLSNELARPI